MLMIHRLGTQIMVSAVDSGWNSCMCVQEPAGNDFSNYLSNLSILCLQQNCLFIGNFNTTEDSVGRASVSYLERIYVT